MPCWYYEKRELRETPSIRTGIDPGTEARYRMEGARFIIDSGTKMGLRFDTCATGVVYFHRFYMFHSFREFNRYVTAATCLFLAGKVEETPKKCKDLIKTTRSMLTDQQFAAFGENPREELMTMERVLLQTLKFDLQVEHPYPYIIKFAKHLKGEKARIEKMVQMAWTFINDGLCTMICLQWEPDVVSVALMYLASRLSKYEITDWEGKLPGSRGKWWESLVSDVTLDVLESICHQVLDLYSSSSQRGNKDKEDSPPPPPPPRPQNNTPHKRSRPVTPEEAAKQEQAAPPAKVSHTEAAATTPHAKPPSPGPRADAHKPPANPPPLPPSSANAGLPPPAMSPSSRTALSQSAADTHHESYQNYDHKANHYSQYNPYVSSNMYSSSFLSQEGSRDIQSLMGNLGSQQPPPNQNNMSQGYNYNSGYNNPNSTSSQYQQPPMPSTYNQPPPPTNYQQPPPPASNYQGSYPPSQQAGYNNQTGGSNNYPPPPGPPPPPHMSSQQPPYHGSGYNQGQSSNHQPPHQQPHQPPHQPPPQPQQNYMQQPPPRFSHSQGGYNQYNQHGRGQHQQQGSSHYPPPPPGGQSYQPPPPTGSYQNYQSNYGPPPRGPPRHPPPPRPGNPPGGLAPVRITGRPR